MSEKMTRIRLPGQRAWSGLQDWGEHSAAEIIALARHYAAHLRNQAELIDAATDEEFQVDLVRGVHRQHLLKSIQVSARQQEK